MLWHPIPMDSYVKDYLPVLLEPLTHYSFGFVACAILLVIALLSSFWMWRVQIRATRQINKARYLIESCDDEKAFTARFQEIDAALRQIRRLRRPWEEFSATLIPPLEGVDDPAYSVYRHTKRPQSYFQPDEILYDVKPVVEGERFIVIGLILTFLGLVAALSSASVIFDGGDNEGMKAALAALLATAGAKFLASVGGLGASLIQSLSQNLSVRKGAAALSKFNDQLEQRLSYASIERIAADQYGLAQRQSVRLENLELDIASALGAKITTAMDRIPGLIGAEFSQAMAPIGTRLDTMTQSLARAPGDMLGSMVGQVTDHIHDASKHSMNSVVTQLDSLASTLNTLVSSLSHGQLEVRGGLDEAVQALAHTSRQFQSSLDHSAQSASGQLDAAAQSIAQTLNAMMSELKAQQTSNSALMERLVKQFEATSAEVNQSLRQRAEVTSNEVASTVTTSLQTLLDEVGVNTKRMAEGVQRSVVKVNELAIARIDELLGASVGKVGASLDSVHKALDGWSTQSAGVAKALAQMNAELGRSQTGLALAAQQIEGASGQFVSAAQGARDAAQPLSAAAGQVVQAVNQLREASSHQLEQIVRGATQIHSALQESRAGIQSLHETWSRQASQLEGADTQLEHAFSQITQNLEQSLEALHRYTGGMGEHVARALQDLGSFVEDLSDTVESLAAKQK